MRRKTHDAGNMLPELKSRKSKVDSHSVNPATI